MWPLPRIREDVLQVHLLLTIRTRLLLANNTPATDAKLMECVVARQFISVLNHTSLVFADQQLIAAHRAHVLLQVPCWHALGRVVLERKGDKVTLSNYDLVGHFINVI